MGGTSAGERIAATGLSLFARGLAFGTAGNISLRDGDDWLLTPTNVSLGALDPARIARLGQDGAHLGGDKPSKEAFLHKAVYDERAGARAVIHLHATHSVALSCLPGTDAENAIPPLTAYYVMKIGRLPLIPYFRPGDPALGEAVRAHMRRGPAVLLANHGPVVAGPSLAAAASAIEELEETARLALLLRGASPRTLTPAQIAELEAVFGAP